MSNNYLLKPIPKISDSDQENIKNLINFIYQGLDI